MNLIEKKQEIENRLLYDVVREVTQIINNGVSVEEMLTAIINLTQDKLKIEEIILFRIIEPKEVIYKSLQPNFISKHRASCESEKNSLIISLHLESKTLGRLVLKLDNQREKLSKEEMEIVTYIKSQLIIILEKMQEQITSEQKEKNEHLSHMHHELRTPLVAILGFSRMLNEEIYGGLNPKQKQYIQGIVTSGEHLLDLVNNFLDIFKIDAYQEELFWETLEIEEICKSVLSMVQPIVAEKGLELNLETDLDMRFFKADERRLKQILVNLLSNAVKFTVQGSITLQVKQQSHELLFSVIDTGIGINPSEQNKLFQTFGQIKSPLSNKYKGSGVGLGLVLSRKLARLHGGEITLVSQEGQGSCFTLHIPLE